MKSISSAKWGWEDISWKFAMLLMWTLWISLAIYVVRDNIIAMHKQEPEKYTWVDEVFRVPRLTR